MIQNSEILITGGYGFIGGHLGQILSAPESGNRVTLMDLRSGEGTTGHDLGLKDVEGVTTFEGSVTEPDDLSDLPRSFDYVIHAAGFLGIANVAAKQALTLDTNITGTRNVLEFAAEHTRKPKVLYFSTSEIYGINCAGPAEDEPAVIPSGGARWCYATGKLAGEYYLRAYNQQYGIGGGIVRPFNVFGPHRYGQNAMTTLVTRAVQNNPIEISGDGLQIRSWCYIEDFCSGILGILEHDSEEVEAFNIGDDRNVFTMLNLAERIKQVTESESDIKVLGNETEDVFYRIPDIDKAREKLGYNPSKDFNEALGDVSEWVAATQGGAVSEH